MTNGKDGGVTDIVDFLIIGAGVIGLAIARRLARSGQSVVIIDSGDIIGGETSSRNSEVIHAGIYYPTGSLKAKLCVSGRQALYRYCRQQNVPHKQCGKLLVATNDEQHASLKQLFEKALANGIEDLQILSVSAAQSMEPNLSCVAALLSPSTGIIDSYQLMQTYLNDAEKAGAILSLKTPVVRGLHKSDYWLVDLGGHEPSDIRAKTVINAAGLQASQVARLLGLAPDHVPTTHFAKGNYFTLKNGASLFSHLIYPIPEPGSLGIHVTLDLAGTIRFGPDLEWVEKIDYSVDTKRAEHFYPAIRKYYPALSDGTLTPAYSGIRPKLSRDPRVDSDFLIETETDHGAPGLICLYGIESPGLTASLAIAERIASGLGIMPTPEDAALFHT